MKKEFEKGMKAKPRTSYTREKPRPVNPPVSPVHVEQSLLDRIVDKIRNVVPDVFAEEVVVGNITYDIPAEIIELAGQLDNNPAKIYAYVRDSVEYTPYYGLMKGSLWTLWEGRGNDMDQAALLSDLLRASGYETRFAIGTVEVEPAYMKLVLGVNTTEEALALLWENGVPAELTSDRKILVEHAWVEARMPYGMYSGECYRGYIASRDACGSAPGRWVPLDPSFTPYNAKLSYPAPDIDYNLTGVFLETLQNGTYGEDYFTGLNFSSLDLAAEALVNLSDEWYAENVGRVYESMTEEEVEAIYADRPPEVTPDIIPGTTPYSPLVFETYSEIPNDYLHMITIRVVEGSTEILSFNIPSIETVGRQLTLDYVPANEDVAEIVNTQASLTDIPAYLLDFRPILMLDSVIIAVGDESTFGINQDLRVTITTPNQVDTVTSPLAVGNYYALAFDLGDMPAENVERVINNTFESLFVDGDMLLDQSYGGYLSTNALTYFSMTDMNYDMLAEATGTRWWRGSPAVAVFGYTYDTNYVGSVPSDISESFSHLDVARNILSVQAEKELEKSFAQMAGGISSSWESQVFGVLGNTTGVSTVDVLSAAAERGVKIQYIASTNIAELEQLSIPENAKEAIRSHVSQGFTAYVPTSTLTIGEWTGVGWLVIDPATGASAWMIGDELGNVLNGGTGEITELGMYTVPYKKAGELTRVEATGTQVNVYKEAVGRLNTDGTFAKLTGTANTYGNRAIEEDGTYYTTGKRIVNVIKTSVKAVSNLGDDIASALKHAARSDWGKSGPLTLKAIRNGVDTVTGKGLLLQAGVYKGKGSVEYKAAKAIEFASDYLNKEVKIAGISGTRGGAISGALSFAGSMLTVADTNAKMKSEYKKGNMNNVAVEAMTGVAKVAAVGVVAGGLAIAGVTGGWAIAGGIVATYALHKTIDWYASTKKT